MSILVVQRPHNVPGLISMNRQQSTPKRASPRQNHRPTHNQSNHHVPSPVATAPAPVPVLSPKLNRKQQHSASHPANQSTAQSPIPALLPSDSPRRNKHVKAASQEQNGTGGRKRSSKTSRQATPPVHLDDLDTGLPEWDSPAPIVDTPQSKPRMKRTPPGVITIGTPTPKGAHTNWQQAALFGSQTHTRTTTPLNVSGLPLGGGPKTAPIQGSFSAPSSPERFPNVPNQHPLQVISRSPTAPNLPSAALSLMTRPGRHMRTPSFPNFPINRPDNRFVSDESPDVDPLEALFRSATLSSASTPQLAGSAPADSSIHARVAKARKGKKGASSAPTTNSKDDFMFASASFQAAPDAMVFPKPGGMSPFATKPAAVPFAGPRLERLSFNLNEDEDSFDESEEDASSDAGVDRPVNPSLFVM